MIDERAWIQIKPQYPLEKIGSMGLDEFVKQGVPRLPVNITNAGKTSALKIIWTSTQILRHTEVPFSSRSRTRTATTGMLFQNDTHPFSAGSDDALTKEEISDLNTGQSYMTIFMKVEFEDIFGKPHESRYCAWRAFGSPEERTSRVYPAKPCTDFTGTATR